MTVTANAGIYRTAPELDSCIRINDNFSRRYYFNSLIDENGIIYKMD